MFQKKTMTARTYENGSNSYGNRFGNSGGFQDSLDTKKAGLEKWKPAEGENLVDFIPFNATEDNPLVIAGKAEVGDPMYSLDYFVHRNVGPNNANIVCLKQYGEDCPLCRESKRLKELGGEENEKKAQKLNAKRRVVYVVHDLKTNKYGYWDTGYKSVEEPIMNRARMTKDPKTQAAANVFDWHDGMSVRFLGTKKKFEGKEYNEPSTFDFEPREPLSDEVLSHSIDLATVIKKTSAEDMEKLISGKAYSVSSQPKPTETTTTNSTPSQSLESANIEDYDDTQSPADLASQAMSAASGQSFNDMKPVESEPKEATPTEQAPTQTTGTTEHKCPFGHGWGETDKHPDCSKCDTTIWENCLDKK